MSAQRERVQPSGWLHDDMEEDLVGADWHQEAIRATVISLRDYARRQRLPWHIGDQLTFIATKPDGTAWRPSPDIMLHPEAGPRKRGEMAVSHDGLPVLIIEVASPTTWSYDVDTREGKAWGYLALGVPNYLVFDPRGDLLDASCQGWQLAGKAVREWRPGPDGRYHLIGLDLSFQPQDDLLRLYDSDGQPVPFYFENAERVGELEAELARLRSQHSP